MGGRASDLSDVVSHTGRHTSPTGRGGGETSIRYIVRRVAFVGRWERRVGGGVSVAGGVGGSSRTVEVATQNQ